MTIQFTSKRYRILQANVGIFRFDGFPELIRSPQLDALTESLNFQLHRIEGEKLEVPISKPGTYRAIFRRLRLQQHRPEDATVRTVEEFNPPSFAVTRDAIERGRCEVQLEGSLFLIRIADSRGRPYSRKQVAFCTTEIVFQIATDNQGEIVFLGDPTVYTIGPMPGETERLDIQIRSL